MDDHIYQSVMTQKRAENRLDTRDSLIDLAAVVRLHEIRIARGVH